MEIRVGRGFCGPREIGHGGYVAGLLAERTAGPVQVTLRAPTPLERTLRLESEGSSHRLLDGDRLIAESEPQSLQIAVPAPPTLPQARAAQQESPSHFQGRGAHPDCFCCSVLREASDALRVFAGPCSVGEQAMVAAAWRPSSSFAGESGELSARYVLASIDCPGAFAFIVDQKSAGLLGRVVFEQFGPVRAEHDHIVIGWQIGIEGRKHFAGTALFDANRTLLAAAKATWF